MPKYPYVPVLIQLIVLTACVFLFGPDVAALIGVVYFALVVPAAGLGLKYLIRATELQNEQIAALEAKVQRIEEQTGL
jgi:hypothetical protein